MERLMEEEEEEEGGWERACRLQSRCT